MMGKFTVLSAAIGVFIACASLANASTSLSRDGWTNWRGQWPGDFWRSGGFDNTTYMTCVGVDGSHGSPEFWSEGYGEDAARGAYSETLSWVNVADRNPAYIEVHCGY